MAILNSLDRNDLRTHSQSIHCSEDQALLNAAVCRLAPTSTTPDTDINQLRADFEEWVEMRLVVKVDRDTTVTVDQDCNTEIVSLEDDLCHFHQFSPPADDHGFMILQYVGENDTVVRLTSSSSRTMDENLLVIICGVLVGLLVCAVLLCLVLLGALFQSRR